MTSTLRIACIGIGMSILNGCSVPTSENQEQPIKKEAIAKEISYVPMSRDAFAPANEIQQWADSYDTTSIHAHAWKLWGAMTAMTGQDYPTKDVADKEKVAQVKLATFSTWYDAYELFLPPEQRPKDNARHYHFPRQVSASPGQTQPNTHGGDEVLSFNKYTQEFYDYVNKHKFYNLKSLCDLNEKLSKQGVPRDKKFIPLDFDNTSTMLKPTYWIIKKDSAVAMPYWKGPNDDVNGTAYPDRPMSTTWEQIVVVNPTSDPVPPGKTFYRDVLNENGIERRAFTDYEVVGLDRFYHVPLTSADIQWIKDAKIFTIGGVKTADLRPGDLALLVGCHVTTAEFGPWTWQTFYWSPDPARKPPVDANVKAPFTNYDMMQAYYMLNQDGSHHVAFNPYLEPPIITPIIRGNPIDKGLGRNSNCMSCHHAAAFPTLNLDPSPANMLTGSYLGSGEVKPDNIVFDGRIQTKYMWGLILFLQGRTSPDGSTDSLSLYPQCNFQ